jgi:hypothetical protein
MPDTKITALTAISTVDPAVDVLPIVDVSDTTMAASGTTKKITTNQILGAGGTATLASATVTGAATVARLIVTGSTIPANGVYLPAANTIGFAANSLDQYRIEPLGVFTWYDGAGGTRMTLNSSGLALGVTPSAWRTGARAIQSGANGWAAFWEQSNGYVNLSFACYEGSANVFNYKTTGELPTTYKQGAGTHSWFTAAAGTAGNPITFIQAMTLNAAGSLVLGAAAVATTATDGFLYIPGCAGAPTGTPTSQTGRVPLVVDTTNNKLYFYSSGSWVAAN